MSVELKPHNLDAYNGVREILERGNRVAVIHPTGTGKSFIALKFIEENPNKKVIYLSPSIPIMIQFKRNMIENSVSFRNVERISYQKLTSLLRNNELDLEADIIILDEFHHLGAPEWGKAVNELLEQNRDAQVLGLSATPMRYLDDEIRDMAEELFDNNVASEITLEEAIATGILSEPIYTTGLYGYEQITRELEEKVEKCSYPDKKKIAQNELEKLRMMLQASVNGLPELLEKSMTNKTGRYIVYCKDIADMEKKMEEASELFGKVNPNMEIMSMSSRDEDIRENEATIKKFEKDNDDGKLKLLFSVNMLNEGYHLSRLDGVIMMRPTHSPTLYYQQLGRALSVGNGRQPIVIDLVDNIDSIEIIKGFSKNLGDVKKREHTENSTRFSISDEIREIKMVIEKIDELVSRKKPLSNEEKLALMIEYMNETGEKITSGTIYKGYNLGGLKNNLRQAYYNGTLNMDENLLQSFIDAGIILEEKEKIRTSTQEKYDFLISMIEKSPEERKSAKMESGLSYDSARNWMQAQYNKGLLNLSKEQIDFLKSNGILNLSTQEREELNKKHERILSYGIELSDILDIEKKYGSFEAFMDKFKRGECEYPFKKRFFIGFRGITISSREMTEKQKANYARFVSEAFKIEEDITYKSGLYIDVDEIDKVIATLSKEKQRILGRWYGVGPEAYTTRRYWSEKIRGAELGFVRNSKLENILKNINEELIGSQRKCQEISSDIEKIEIMKRCMIDENGNLKTKLNVKEFEENGISREDIETIFSIIIDDNGNFHGTPKIQTEDVSIKELGLSARSYNCLHRVGIDSVSELVKKSPSDIMEIRNMGAKSYAEIIEKVKTLGYEIDVDEAGNEKFVCINGEKHEESFTNLAVTLIEQCDTIIASLTEKLNAANEERLRIEKRKTEGYDRACMFYLEHENIFQADFIVPSIDSIDVGQKNSERKKALLESIRASQEELTRLNADLDAHNNTHFDTKEI